MKFEIVLSRDALVHLRYFTARQRSTILDSIEEQLSFKPTVRTRQRKIMRSNPLASWELRIGDFRVYYDVNEYPKPTVEIIAIGKKQRNVIEIGGEEIDL